jgi:hypothetical protein
MAEAAVDNGQLLLGLPGPACQTLVDQLVKSGSRRLVELMQLCRETRTLVLTHARTIKVLVQGTSNHAALHQAASRMGMDLEVYIDFTGCEEEEVERLLIEASTSHTANGRGWTGVKELTVEVSISSVSNQVLLHAHAPCPMQLCLHGAAWVGRVASTSSLNSCTCMCMHCTSFSVALVPSWCRRP